MKGVVFTEFIEMVEDTFSYEVADHIIEASDLPSGGVYTSLGTYDHQEMVQLVTHLSAQTDVPVSDLVQAFGKHLFSRFVEGYPQFFAGVPTAFDFLKGIEEHIHVEVLKLYPDAQLPTFDCQNGTPGRLEMTYKSQRPFADLAEGLIVGCIEHFGENIEYVREDLPGTPGTSARFILTVVEGA